MGERWRQSLFMCWIFTSHCQWCKFTTATSIYCLPPSPPLPALILYSPYKPPHLQPTTTTPRYQHSASTHLMSRCIYSLPSPPPSSALSLYSPYEPPHLQSTTTTAVASTQPLLTLWAATSTIYHHHPCCQHSASTHLISRRIFLTKLSNFACLINCSFGWLNYHNRRDISD